MLRLLCIFHRRSNKITLPSWPSFQATKFQIYALKYSLLCPFIFSSRLSLVPFICHNSRKLTTFFGAIMYNYVPHNLSSAKYKCSLQTESTPLTINEHWACTDKRKIMATHWKREESEILRGPSPGLQTANKRGATRQQSCLRLWNAGVASKWFQL